MSSSTRKAKVKDKVYETSGGDFVVRKEKSKPGFYDPWNGSWGSRIDFPNYREMQERIMASAFTISSMEYRGSPIIDTEDDVQS